MSPFRAQQSLGHRLATGPEPSQRDLHLPNITHQTALLNLSQHEPHQLIRGIVGAPAGLAEPNVARGNGQEDVDHFVLLRGFGRGRGNAGPRGLRRRLRRLHQRDVRVVFVRENVQSVRLGEVRGEVVVEGVEEVHVEEGGGRVVVAAVAVAAGGRLGGLVGRDTRDDVAGSGGAFGCALSWFEGSS